MAGHSAWKNIRHRKAAADARRGKAWSKCARAIIVAARTGGGDPDANLALRSAIDEARAVNMPRDTIDKAIKKGTGELASEHYESAMYEGYGPGGVAFLLEILTDNRNRTAPEIKGIFEQHAGNLGTKGCVAHVFQSRGEFLISKKANEDTAMTAALEAGAEDFTDNGDTWRILCEPTAFVKVRQALEAAKLPIDSAQLTQVPNSTITCTGDVAQQLLKLLEALEDHDDVQKVHANFEIPESELAALG